MVNSICDCEGGRYRVRLGRGLKDVYIFRRT